MISYHLVFDYQKLEHLPGYLVLLLIKGGMHVVLPPRSRLVQLRQYRLVVRSRGAPEEMERCRILVSLSSMTLVHRRGGLRVVLPRLLHQISFGE